MSRLFHSPARLALVAIVALLVVAMVYLNGGKDVSYVDTYTFQQSYREYRPDGNQYRIAVVADMDTNSKVSNDPTKWKSILKKGELRREDDGTYSVVWKEEVLAVEFFLTHRNN